MANYKNYECGDCLYNTGDDGDGCKCEKTGKAIDICDKACKKFKLFDDFE